MKFRALLVERVYQFQGTVGVLFMQTTIAPAMNLQQNPPSPSEYLACDEIQGVIGGEGGF
jgi:hypothetical protein